MNSTWLGVCLAALAVVDGGFAGFRDAAGRDGRIFKEQYYRRAVRRGLAHGAASACLGALVVLGAVMLSGDTDAALHSLERPGAVLVGMFSAYALVVLAALGVWMVAEADLRTLASVTVLGPFTLLRPFVILAAAALAIWASVNVTGALVSAVVCGFQLAVEPWMGRAWRGGGRPLD